MGLKYDNVDDATDVLLWAVDMADDYGSKVQDYHDEILDASSLEELEATLFSGIQLIQESESDGMHPRIFNDIMQATAYLLGTEDYTSSNVMAHTMALSSLSNWHSAIYDLNNGYDYTDDPEGFLADIESRDEIAALKLDVKGLGKIEKEVSTILADSVHEI